MVYQERCMASSKWSPIPVACSSFWRVSVSMSVSTQIKDFPVNIIWSFQMLLRFHTRDYYGNYVSMGLYERVIYSSKPGKSIESKQLSLKLTFWIDMSQWFVPLNISVKTSFIQHLHQQCGGGNSQCNLQGCRQPNSMLKASDFRRTSED